MDVTIAVVYFEDASSGAAGPVELHFVDDHFEFRVSFAVAQSYTNVTRIDFLDPYHPLSVIW